MRAMRLVCLQLEFKLNHLWVGVYWERWPDPYRVDLWIAIPFVALRIAWAKA